MGLRDRLRSPWLTASLAILLLALAGAAAVATGVLTLPSIQIDLGLFPSPSTGFAVATASPVPSPTGPSPEPTFVRPTPSPEPTFVTYRVVSGDTLTAIAKRFKTTPRSIAWWNRGTYPSLDPESPRYQPNRIELGWVLVVLPGAVVDENNPPTPSPAASA